MLERVSLPEPGDEEILVRVRGTGICHSDAHYRRGTSPAGPLPLTLGHEVAGTVEETGRGVTSVERAQRVCLHYLVTCGRCHFCRQGQEQFCEQGRMLGKTRDGGYAEYVVVPARNAVPVPEQVSFEHAAVLMCSAATSFHALRKSGLRAGERVAVFGVGGLGMSARPFQIDAYTEILGREAEIIGCSDHLLTELPLLLELARRGVLDLSRIVTRTVALDAGAVNAVLDDLDRFDADTRTVIVP